MKTTELEGKTLHIPQMNYAGSRVVAAVFRSCGIKAEVSPYSDAHTLELGGKYTSGDECYPQKIVLGDFLKLTEREDFDPQKTAFFMAASNGPCRFGQYGHLIEKIMRDLGYGDSIIFMPTSESAYSLPGKQNKSFNRIVWWAFVVSDCLHKLLLKTRPYELNKGEADEVFRRSTDNMCSLLEQRGKDKELFRSIIGALTTTRDNFRKIPIKYDPEFPLIGVVGEIFCRLNCFSNDDMVRRIEQAGAETWMSDVGEWVWYTKLEQIKRLRRYGKRFSKEMLIVKIKYHIQKSDEHKLLKPFYNDFRGYEETDIARLLSYSKFYLPCPVNAGGEMVVNIGRSVYLYEKGVDGIVDISPFTCMNGIVSEAIYPRVSRDHENIPIRVFYFDRTQTDLDRDIGIFIELARSFKRRKTRRRSGN